MKSKPWTSPGDLRGQVLRLWECGKLLADEITFPLELRLRGPDARALGERFEEVRRWIHELETLPYCAIEWAEINHRQLGRNRIPARVVVACESAALEWIGKAAEAARYRALRDRTLAVLPELAGWLPRRALRVLENAADWEQVLAVLVWFREHPRCGLYLRQLEIPGVDTKFIEARKPLLGELLDVVMRTEVAERTARHFEPRYGLAAKAPQIRFRILDRRYAIAGLTDLAVVPAEFAALDLPVTRIFLTENEINGLAFPAVPESIVIFGLGYGLDRLAEARWLETRALHYWGDIDTHGFRILDRLRAIFPAVRSLLMDRETLLRHRPLWVEESSSHTGDLLRLTPDEERLYDELRYNRLGDRVRLEQERIPFGWVEHVLRGISAPA
jgi:hypothetical protein